MKTVKCQGGLGNQLFGLAFAHSVAHLSGKPVALDIASFRNYRYGYPFALQGLAERLGLAVVSKPLLSHRLTGVMMRRMGLVGTDAKPPKTDKDSLSLVNGQAYFDGYWQNEAFIADPGVIRHEVRRFLLERAPDVVAEDVVIHYRTYADEVVPGRRATPGAAYVARALAAIGPASRAVLVSDDAARALTQLGDLADRLIPAPPGDLYADMARLLRARHLVLTNSSFSWWGGYCSGARTIIYPEQDGFFHYPAPAARFVCL